MEKNRKLLNIGRLSNNNLSKKALFSAFFCFCALLSTAPLATTECSTLKFDETATLKYVHDGDTIRLTDGRKVRLLGIDTPELARKGRPAQPFALDAKKALKSLLSKNNGKVNLVYGTEKKDRYKRTLAHLYLNNGENVQSKLISQGLAIAFATPPNIWMSDCYSSIESAARLTNRGIWADPKYKAKNTNQITSDTKGFQIIEGHVENVSIKPKNVWINLENDLSIQIRKKDRHYFDDETLGCLAGKPIQIRGWLHSKEKSSYMSLRHPSALTLIGDKTCN